MENGIVLSDFHESSLFSFFVQHPFLRGATDPKPILELLAEYKAEIVEEEIMDIQDDSDVSASDQNDNRVEKCVGWKETSLFAKATNCLLRFNSRKKSCEKLPEDFRAGSSMVSFKGRIYVLHEVRTKMHEVRTKQTANFI